MITRFDQIEQSVQDFVKDGLLANSYTTELVAVRDSFPTPEERAAELERTTVACGFNFDDGGRQIELGSDLTMKVHTIEFWTFGIKPGQARNVAHVIEALVASSGYSIPLKAIEQDGQPVIDYLVVPDQRGVSVTRQIAHSPRTWDRYVWSTIVKVEDTYFPSQLLVTDA